MEVHIELAAEELFKIGPFSVTNSFLTMILVMALILVVGAPASSNANRLVEVARQCGAEAHLIESADEIQPEWIHGDVGLTAGASTPEEIVQACARRIQELGEYRLEEFRLTEERVMFPLPGDLLVDATRAGVAVGAGNERAAARANAATGR